MTFLYKMFYVYILLSAKTGQFYVGSTGNLLDRVERHNAGRSKATKSGCPWCLVMAEPYSTRGDAMKREMEIKGWKSHARIQALVSASR